MIDMKEYVRVRRKAQQKHQQRKAIQPREMFCKILQKPVVMVIEYLDYKGSPYWHSNYQAFCSNMVFCYNNNIKCKYSGISAFYPDPFDRNFSDDYYREFVGEDEYQRLEEIRRTLREEQNPS